MDPLIGSALIGGAASLLGGLFGTSQQNQNIDKQIAAQKEENRLNRDWNLNLARMQREWSLSDWYREAQYNSPANQRAMLSVAGMNPDLAYGQNISAPSTNATTPAPSAPTDVSALGQKRTYGDVIASAVSQTVNNMKTLADTKKTNQETKNLVVSGKILTAESAYTAIKNEQSIAINNSEIYLNHSLAELNHAKMEEVAGTISKLTAETESIRQGILESKSRISKMDADIAFQRIRLALDSKLIDAKVQEIASNIKKNNTWCAATVQELAAKLKVMAATTLNIQSSTNINQKSIFKLDQEIQGLAISNDMATFNFDQAKDFDSWERSARITRDFAIGAGQITDAVLGVVSRGLTKFKSPSSGNGDYVSRPEFWSSSTR